MSNNLVSQQLSIPYWQMSQVEAFSDKQDTQMMEVAPSHPASDQVAVSEQRSRLVEPLPNNPGSQNPAMSRKQMFQPMKPEVGNPGSQHFLLPNQQAEDMGAMLDDACSQKPAVPSKRKADVDPMFNNVMPPHLLMPNKRSTQMLHLPNSPGLPQLTALSKKATSMQSMPNTPGQTSSAPNKRMVRNESISSKGGSQRVQTPKGRSAQMEPSPKGAMESSQAVRSKMRESLAAALALACQHQDADPKKEKDSQSEAAITLQHTQENSQPAESTSPSKGNSCAKIHDGNQNTSAGTSVNESMGNSAETFKVYGQDFQYNSVFPVEDVSFSDSFFVKDDLLQVNGLSWALEFDSPVPSAKEVPTAGKTLAVQEEDVRDEAKQSLQENVGGKVAEQSVQSPDNLAFKIETELFKLFGGVNKKYKEKGRSLLFNLKDRNNPELRERVMAGEISPERLCSMTAEELASKELSDWRIAKAEELAQMKVLPDTGNDIRRLVKKTHKGEYHVEVDKDDGVSVEVSAGTSVTQFQPKKKEAKAHRRSETDELKNVEDIVAEQSNSENEDFAGSLVIPNDGTDLMQGMIVDDLKDAEFLPPIVSLDEFMESLNSEPPFENLPVDAGQATPLSGEENSETGNELVASDQGSEDPVETATVRADKGDVKSIEVGMDVKSSESSVERKISPPSSTAMADHVWEGVLQLSISTLVTVIGLFRSGEKASTKEWPKSLEVKGRVRLDAFEKFLQELPMSRSRAVMVVHFALKEGYSETERASLFEVSNSYVLDERLGYAEPNPGAELYICPPHTRIVDMISKSLSKPNTEILKSNDINGLIGVVVWRKAQIKSPNSSLHHKHGSNKQHVTSRRHHEKDINVNANLAAKVPFVAPRNKPEPDDDDDDIPPGFGPAAAGGDDDLPEFNFSGNMNLSTPKFPSPGPRITPSHTNTQASSRSVNQIRELIHKYGQPETNVASKRASGLGIRPWNDDDDDDIPEWQPQAPQLPHIRQQLNVHGFQPPVLDRIGNQHLVTAAQQPLRQLGTPVAMSMQQNLEPTWHQGGRLVQPSEPHGSQPSSSLAHHHPGMNWRQEAPRSRGF